LEDGGLIKMIKILLTSAGGLVMPEIINTLRKDSDEEIYIIGIDATRDAIGFKFADNSFVAPLGDNKHYIPYIKKLVKKEKIDIIVPFSDEEVVVLSKNKKEFEEMKVKIICNDYQITKRIINKGYLLSFLKDRKFSVPKFFLPKTEKEMIFYAKKLGYPQKPFVLKPVLGRGGRGFTIITNKNNFFYEKDRCKFDLGQIIKEIRKNKFFPKILMMEYLSGDEYSTDVLAEKGKVIYSLSRKRINTVFGPSLKGEFDNNQAVLEIIKELTDIFKLDLIFNVQLKYRNKKNSYPYIVEINPRAGGTIALNSKAGIPLLFWGIKKTLGQDFPRDKKSKFVKFWRYYQDYYEKI
jgi:carbamoyl-phosphate synthase large subunit